MHVDRSHVVTELRWHLSLQFGKNWTMSFEHTEQQQKNTFHPDNEFNGKNTLFLTHSFTSQSIKAIIVTRKSFIIRFCC